MFLHLDWPSDFRQILFLYKKRSPGEICFPLFRKVSTEVSKNVFQIYKLRSVSTTVHCRKMVNTRNVPLGELTEKIWLRIGTSVGPL